MLYCFVDLCAGIGGTRLAFERTGGTCVYAIEIDKFACMTYMKNFNHDPIGDILLIDENSIPNHDFLIAGFPCQPFSLSGVAKRNSLHKPHGLDCNEKGKIIFKILNIIEMKKPKGFLLENVKHLKYHNKGNTYKKIKELLEDKGYNVYEQIIDAKSSVPQHRERIYIIGFKKELNVKYKFPEIPYFKPRLYNILENNVNDKYTLSNNLWNYLQKYKKRHKKKGNGFGYGLTDLNRITRTLSARYYKDGAEILIPQEHKNPRRLTPRECARLMGFPETFKIPVSDTQAYKQFGNSVVIPIVEYLAWSMVECLYQNQTLSPLTSLFQGSETSKDGFSYGENLTTPIFHGEKQEIPILA